MDSRVAGSHGTPFRFPEKLGVLDPDLTMRVLASAADVAMIVDRGGVITDVASAGADPPINGLLDWLDKKWIDTVTADSRPKVEELLRQSSGEGPPRWREINQIVAGGEAVPLRFLTFSAARKGPIVAIGRDLRAIAMMQQRVLQAQQVMERDYARLRETEARYRLLFQLAGEPIMILDAQTGRVLELNSAAEAILQAKPETLVGRPLTALLEPASQAGAATLLAAPRSGKPSDPVVLHFSRVAQACVANAVLFRQDRAAHLMVRLSAPGALAQPDPDRRLVTIVEMLPDAFVAVDQELRIVAHNSAFLDMAQLADHDAAAGQSLERFVGRSSVDLRVLQAALREHGVVRNFSTVMRGRLGATEDVEVSAVALTETDEQVMGLSIRGISRRLADQPAGEHELPRSVGQLTSLVGRVSLKDIVRETTDRIERLCIEAALRLTDDNRASAAELLGLSRQSFYSKLHRHGLGNLSAEDE